MKHDHLTTGALALLLTTSLVTAQRTWIVDAAKGPGYDFTDLPPAVKAAKDGDRIVVRKGSYKGLYTGAKGISILGESGARVAVGHDFALAAGLPAGKRLVVRGLTLASTHVDYLAINGCKGSVHLLDLDFEGYEYVDNGLYVMNCPAVTIDGCTRLPRSSISKSRVVLNGSSGRRVRAWNSNLTLTACVLAGDSSNKHHRAKAAITTFDCQVQVHSGAYTGGGGKFGEGPGIVGTGGTLTLDPRARVDTAATGFTKITKRPLPALTAKGGKLGGSADLTLESSATMPFAVFGSLAAQPLAKELDLWLDLRFLHLVATGVQSSTGRWEGKAAIPNLQVLRGLVLGYQAIEVDLKNPSFELSNPAFVAAH